jgi:glycosyltransferase involved in cell wall biosynthesis
MRIIQLIDSLETGGAERMAVNYANALVGEVAFSGLVVTRKEGDLKNQLHAKVDYLFLNRTATLDWNALLKLRAFVVQNKVSIIHAHSSSFLIATLLKIMLPKIKLVWHDHNGNRVFNNATDNRIIKWSSVFFDGIITVNLELEQWAKTHLNSKKVIYIPNFTSVSTNQIRQTVLKGVEGKRIVCLANLRQPKNHITLLNAFLNSAVFKQDWTLHFIGKDNKDSYSQELRIFIKENFLEEHVFIYGSCQDVYPILSQASVGILCSTYEGFPVTLLEYGLSKLAVISTNVGFCPSIIDDQVNGLLINPLATDSIEKAIVDVTHNPGRRSEMASKLNDFVVNQYSEHTILKHVLTFYNLVIEK